MNSSILNTQNSNEITMRAKNTLEKDIKNIQQNSSTNIDFDIPENLMPGEQKDMETTMLIMNKLVSLIEIEDNAENKNQRSNLVENL